MNKKTTVNYDDCIDKKRVSLESFDVDSTGTDFYEYHWKHMPEFENEKNKPYKKLIVTFENEDDYIKFQETINQTLTKNTKSVWFPKKENEKNCMYRWIYEE